MYNCGFFYNIAATNVYESGLLQWHAKQSFCYLFRCNSINEINHLTALILKTCRHHHYIQLNLQVYFQKLKDKGCRHIKFCHAPQCRVLPPSKFNGIFQCYCHLSWKFHDGSGSRNVTIKESHRVTDITIQLETQAVKNNTSPAVAGTRQ